MQIDWPTFALIGACLYLWPGIGVASIVIGKPRALRDVAAFTYAALLWPLVRY